MQPVEDIWTCNRCGWTYPNHHPSAKHRRNHKKVCGKVPGHIIDDHHGHAHGGSSDEASSGDENHHDSAPPTVTPTLAVERQSRSFDLSAALQKSETAALAATADEESAAAPLGVSKTTLQEGPKTEPVIEAFKPEDSQKPVLGSAVPHPEEDIWICRECGWTYPNAHPSAKHRRNHKKHCAGKAGAVVHGSSDDDSDVEHRARKGAESAVKANAAKPAPTEAEPEGQKAEPGLTPILSSTREFSLESGAPKERVPVAVEDAPKDVQATVAVVEAPTTPVPVVAPKGSAISHPDDDIWICKECGWTYPNHHPSAKHRRNHKKICPGKFAAVVPAPGGSSDEDSGDEHHHQSLVPEAKEAVKEAPPTESVAREFNLESLTNPAAIVDVQDEKKLESNVTLLSVVQLPEVSTDLRSDKAAVPEETEKEIPAETPAVESKDAKQDGVTDLKALAASKTPSGAVPHPEEDVWKCQHCNWTYPNAHPSAKHRRNHKKHCPGEAAAKGGSSDDDSDHETHSSALAKEHTPVTASPPTEDLVACVSRDVQLPTVEVKGRETSALPSPKLEEPTIEEAPPAPEQPQEKDVTVVDKSPPAVSSLAPQATGSAVPHPEDPNGMWICKACGWTYPNAHPSAKHKRNHKTHCPGKPAAVGHAPGGSSDDDSDNGSSHRGQKSAATSETAPVEAPVLQERAIPDLGGQQPNVAAKVEVTERAPLGQLVSEERSREQEAKNKEESKSSLAPAAPKAPHDPKSSWVCKECGWTYPNPHPSAKHRRNHKKVCKKTTNSTGGGSSSDASSDDEHIGHFGKKKCFPCL